MQKIFSLLLIFSVLALASCQNNNDNQNNTETKQIFTLKTTRLADFSRDFSREYSAIIEANSTLEIPAETSGEVKHIFYNEWQQIEAWKTIIALADKMANYDLMLLQAKNAITLQEASNANTLTNIDTQISNAEIQLERARESYRSLKEKNNLQYDNIVKNNKDQLATLNDTYKNQLSTAENMMTSFLYSADKILGMTEENKFINYNWEAYLGQKNNIGISRSENWWNALYAARGKIRNHIDEKNSLNNENSEKNFTALSEGYSALRELSDAMIEMLQNNIHGVHLTEAMTNSWLMEWNTLRNSVTQAESGFLAWKSQSKNFLENYKTQEEATKLAINSQNRGLSGAEFNNLEANSDLKLAYNNTSISLREAIIQSELNLRQAEETLKNLQKTRATTLAQLSASLENARISLTQAQRNASKLSIKAPISGKITKIRAEIWEQVNAGKILVEFVGTEANATIEVDPRMALLLEIWQNITAEIGDEKILGTISAISTTPGKNMLSTIRMSFSDGKKFIGQSAKIILQTENTPTNTAYLLPINSVKILSENEWKIFYYKNGEIISENIRLGNMYGSSIEAFIENDENTEIITSDIGNYDKNIHTLQKE